MCPGPSGEHVYNMYPGSSQVTPGTAPCTQHSSVSDGRQYTVTGLFQDTGGGFPYMYSCATEPPARIGTCTRCPPGSPRTPLLIHKGFFPGSPGDGARLWGRLKRGRHRMRGASRRLGPARRAFARGWGYLRRNAAMARSFVACPMGLSCQGKNAMEYLHCIKGVAFPYIPTQKILISPTMARTLEHYGAKEKPNI